MATANSEPASTSADQQSGAFIEPDWRRAAMPQSRRFESPVTLKFDHNISVVASQSVDTGSALWDAAIVLASYFCSERSFPAGFWHGKKVCEIGAGCGVTGIVAAQLGADVVLTELEDELKLLEKNCLENPIFPSPSSVASGSPSSGSTTVKEFFWGNDASHLGIPFDVIIAADCVYELQLFDQLVKALTDITSPQTKAYFCIEHRWSDVEQWWWKEVKKHFNVRLIPQEQHGTMSHPKIDIYELKRKVMYTPPAFSV